MKLRRALYVNDASLLELSADGRLYLDGTPLGLLTDINMDEIDKRDIGFQAAAAAFKDHLERNGDVAG